DKSGDWTVDPTMILVDGLIRLQHRLKAAEKSGQAIAPSLPIVVRITLDGRHRFAPPNVGPLAVDKVRNLARQLASANLDPHYVEVPTGAHERMAWGGMHSKVLVVDGYKAVVTGANAQRFNTIGKSWHDAGYILKGEIGAALQHDFDDAWNESGEAT